MSLKPEPEAEASKEVRAEKTSGGNDVSAETVKSATTSTKRTAHLMPRRNLLKTLDDRFSNLNRRAKKISNDLFRQIGGKIEYIDEQLLGQLGSADSQEPKDASTARAHDAVETRPLAALAHTVRYPDLDDYFHHALFYLHDYLIDLKWHEADLNEMESADLAYANERLPFMKGFIEFQNNLSRLTGTELLRTTSVTAKEPIKGTEYSVQTARPLPGLSEGTRTKRSSIGSPRLKSISPAGRKRRVRFADSPPPEDSPQADQGASGSAEFDRGADLRLQELVQQDIRDNHSIYALDLLLCSINLLVQRLTDKLVDWSSQFRSNFNDALANILKSKQKVRTAQLRSVVRKLKVYNDVHLTVLDYLNEIRQTYLIKYTAGILVARDAERIQNDFKLPKLNIYIQRISLDVESKLILRLARQCATIVFDLLVAELNLDPFQMHSKGEENLLNFVSSWLSVEEVLFGFAGRAQPPRAAAAAKAVTQTQRKISDISFEQGTSLGEQFKSSSRILNQMDNLAELTRVILRSISGRLRNPQQISYFLEILFYALERAFDIICQQLTAVMNEQIATKIRCLKFIHIMGSMVKVILGEAARNKIDLNKKQIEIKMAKFTDLFVLKRAHVSNKTT